MPRPQVRGKGVENKFFVMLDFRNDARLETIYCWIQSTMVLGYSETTIRLSLASSRGVDFLKDERTE